MADKESGKDRSREQPRRRSNSPVATKEELNEKRIGLIVYVGNLPTSWRENDIRNFFEEYGKINSVELIKRNKGFSGSALVSFGSLSKAEEAIERLKNTVIPGAARPVNIKWLDTEEQRLGLGQHDDHKLFVGSLPRQASR